MATLRLSRARCVIARLDPALPGITEKHETEESEAAIVARSSVESRLRELKKLLDDGLITPQEYDGKRADILNEL